MLHINKILSLLTNPKIQTLVLIALIALGTDGPPAS